MTALEEIQMEMDLRPRHLKVIGSQSKFIPVELLLLITPILVTVIGLCFCKMRLVLR